MGDKQYNKSILSYMAKVAEIFQWNRNICFTKTLLSERWYGQIIVIYE